MGKAESFILLFLSDFKWNKENNTLPEVKKYQCQDTGEKYQGSQTNDAPVKSLLSAAHEDGADISKILCITSKDVYDKTIPITGCTAYQKFEEMVKKYAVERNYKIPEVIPIFYDFQLALGNRTDICEKERTGYLYQQIADAAHTMEHPNVYIDYTGGMRDVSFFMTGIIKYLEFDSVSCKKIIYSNRQTAVIYNINYIYDMFQLVSGVEEFVTTGNARQLGLLFEQKKESPIHDILQAIINFSNSISLCWLTSIDEDIRKISVSLAELEENSQAQKDVFYSMFCTLIPSIREKMSLDKIVYENQIEYPFLIQWCIENGLIQQALTLYVEKMPHYYFARRKIPDVIEVNKAKEKPGGDVETAAFYTDLFDYYYNLFVREKRQQGEYVEKVKGTYRKKIRALSYLEQQEDGKKLFERMKYYLAIKILRNRINHASEKSMTEDEREAVEYLKQKGIDVNLNYNKVVYLLKEGNKINLPDES